MNSDIRIHGTNSAVEIAAVVAVLTRNPRPTRPPAGIERWRQIRRAALTKPAQQFRTRSAARNS